MWISLSLSLYIYIYWNRPRRPNPRLTLAHVSRSHLPVKVRKGHEKVIWSPPHKSWERSRRVQRFANKRNDFLNERYFLEYLRSALASRKMLLWLGFCSFWPNKRPVAAEPRGCPHGSAATGRFLSQNEQNPSHSNISSKVEPFSTSKSCCG